MAYWVVFDAHSSKWPIEVQNQNNKSIFVNTCHGHLQCFPPEVDPRLTGLDDLLFDPTRFTVTLSLLSLVVCTTTTMCD